VRRCGLDLSGSGEEQEAGFCQHGNETSCFIRGVELFVYLSDYHGLCSMDLVTYVIKAY
jgi:hypothetical protein